MAKLSKHTLKTPVKQSSIDFVFEPFVPVIAKGLINGKGFFIAIIGPMSTSEALVNVLWKANSNITSTDISVNMSNWNAHITLDGAIAIIG